MYEYSDNNDNSIIVIFLVCVVIFCLGMCSGSQLDHNADNLVITTVEYSNTYGTYRYETSGALEFTSKKLFKVGDTVSIQIKK